MTSFHKVSVKFKFVASELEVALREGANLVTQRQAAEALALDRARDRQAQDTLTEQSKAAGYEKRRRRAERRAR